MVAPLIKSTSPAAVTAAFANSFHLNRLRSASNTSRCTCLFSSMNILVHLLNEVQRNLKSVTTTLPMHTPQLTESFIERKKNRQKGDP
eukprot:6378175-Amphidinium_carterae.1